MTKKVLLALGLTALSLGATGCNMVRGAAEDVKSVADAVDKET